MTSYEIIKALRQICLDADIETQITLLKIIEELEWRFQK